jgi:hypothetical protein
VIELTNKKHVEKGRCEVTLKKLPVGIESFSEFFSEEFYYVDKTDFIADLLNNWGKINLFTRPRRFGKSLTMSMLKTFFEIGCDKTLFNELKVSKNQKLCEEYMGKFPVISITLKGVDGLSFIQARNALCDLIGQEALRFHFLTESTKLSEEDKKRYLQLIEISPPTNDENQAVFSMSNSMLEKSLQLLSTLLAKHYNQKVILLIDEYDVPLDKAFQSGYYNEMVSLIRNLLGNALKTNEDLQFAVLTGCLRISKESIFTGLNNFKVHTITDFRYSEYFGFTDEEVKALLEYYGLSKHYDTVKEWYDGYQFGNTNVYCPWDVINYCDEVRANPNLYPKNYWANTSGNGMIRRFINKATSQTKREIEQLIAMESIVKPVNQELTYSELDTTIDNLWSVLFTTGYLTQHKCIDGTNYELVIPNLEIRDLFVKEIKEWFNETSKNDHSTIEQFCVAFPHGDAEQIEKQLNKYLWNSISIRDTAVRNHLKENFYHGMLLGILQYEADWVIRSNVESGIGYGDILIETPERIGIVIELKYAQDNKLNEHCKEALTQIENNQYDAYLIDEGMETIVKYGIAFYKKNCKVAIRSDF